MFNFPWIQRKPKKINVAEAQSYVDGVNVARMQIEFITEFRETYGEEFFLKNGGMAIAVGPMQAFLGLAVKNGHIKVVEKEDNATS